MKTVKILTALIVFVAAISATTYAASEPCDVNTFTTDIDGSLRGVVKTTSDACEGSEAVFNIGNLDKKLGSCTIENRGCTTGVLEVTQEEKNKLKEREEVRFAYRLSINNELDNSKLFRITINTDSAQYQIYKNNNQGLVKNPEQSNGGVGASTGTCAIVDHSLPERITFGDQFDLVINTEFCEGTVELFKGINKLEPIKVGSCTIQNDSCVIQVDTRADETSQIPNYIDVKREVYSIKTNGITKLINDIKIYPYISKAQSGDDAATVVEGKSVTVNVCENDKTFVTGSIIQIVGSPIYGTASVSGCKISYTANNVRGNVEDVVTYNIVKDDEVLSTADLKIGVSNRGGSNRYVPIFDTTGEVPLPIGSSIDPAPPGTGQVPAIFTGIVDWILNLWESIFGSSSTNSQEIV